MNKEWIIYKHTNKINGKIYIGQTCQKLSDRWRNNGNGYKKTSPIFWKAIQKYGWDNFEHEIIEKNILSKEEVNERERYWIKFYDCCVLDGKDKGYNADRGGSGMSTEQASKLSKQNWENEDYRKKFCKPVICLNNQKIYSSIIEASRETGIDKSSIGRVCRGEKHSAGVDENGKMIEWAFYEEEKEYIYQDPSLKDKKLKKVVCTTTGKIFNSITEAANFYKINRTGISNCISGKQKTCGQLEDQTRLCWSIYEENKEYKKETNSGKSNKKVKCITTNQIFNSIKEAADFINRQAPNLSACLHGRSKTCGVDKDGHPLKWEFYNEEEDYEE